MFKFLGALLTLAVALGLLIVTWPPLFGLQTTVIVAQITAMRGLLVACCVAALVLFLIIGIIRPLRGFAGSMAVVMFLGAVANTGILVYRGFDDSALPAKTESAISVLSWNTKGNAMGSAAIAKLALDSGADIVALPETRNQTGLEVAAAMKAAGKPMNVFTESFGKIAAASSTTVLISPALGSYTQATSNGVGASNTLVVPSVVLRPTDGRGPTIIASHAVSPSTPQMHNWREDLAWLAAQCDAENVIIAGDFNATLDSMAGLGRDGAALGRCNDAGQATHTAALGTWPTNIPALLGSPIDHVFATPIWDIAAMKVHTEFDQAGSDHRPITVRLEPAAAD
ncbi:endonuclease/exonuclease/phosphatase family protein [Mycetocola lacteus]|uniref:Endonuclease/exonuclease/phosphatase family protein n=1 Tax=Mycetocola lacteus TaxID=76637 RepID=A0A3L7AJQ7_9MICO|nr:endonuclease/exonuclease/phosphatase family protein [Mycetocola lacteus]RLP80753.1 endonuclease/exonuclease/phosphatase family protein [Mycetocola lacteus]RLP84538.1 endonuclease/exonuclease/phosphatase family protein [Mycetocola lacteus]